MEEFCENCGAKITGNTNFCPDCGSEIKRNILETPINFCPECGKKISPDEDFCSECGTHLNKAKTSEGFIEKFKIPIIVGLVVIILIIGGLVILSQTSSDNTPVSLPATTVTVGAEYFELPGEFALSASPLDIDTEGSVISFSQTFTHGSESINIAVMSSPYDVDLESVAASEGGVHKTLMGYNGYYQENDIGHYSFTFVLDDKICVIETTSPYLFDEIKVL